jgi:hypothetical protein
VFIIFAMFLAVIAIRGKQMWGCVREGVSFARQVLHTFLLKVSSKRISNFHNSLFRDIIGTSRVIRKITAKFYCS